MERKTSWWDGWVVAGDALKRCLSGDVSYPRERALVNRRGRLGVASATLQLHSPNCRLARLSVLYLNTWRICSLGRCLLPLYLRNRERERERTGRKRKKNVTSCSLLDIHLCQIFIFFRLYSANPSLVSFTNRRCSYSLSLDCLSSAA